MSPASRDLDAAVAVLRSGGLVAFPTETVYGLGADAENPVALRRLYAVKRRPPDHPVIVHLAVGEPIDRWAAAVPDAARMLAARFWPGPLTLLLPRSARVPDEVTGGRDSVGLRVPDQPVAQALLGAFGGGIAAPSANRYGKVSPTTAADVWADLDGDVDVVLDGGPCTVGVESTIVDCTGTELAIVRLGGVTEPDLEAALGAPLARRDQGEVAAPGTHAGHYAPRAIVELVTADAVAARVQVAAEAGERVGVLALVGTMATSDDARVLDVVVLDAPRDPADFARVLYARLRDADRRGLDRLLVVPPAPVGIGAAVCDRLRRAAAGRPEDDA